MMNSAAEAVIYMMCQKLWRTLHKCHATEVLNRHVQSATATHVPWVVAHTRRSLATNYKHSSRFSRVHASEKRTITSLSMT